MFKLRKIFFCFLVFSLISCKNDTLNKMLGNFSRKTTQKNNIKQNKDNSVNPEIEKIILKWNNATSNKDTATLESMLAEKIEYYQRTVSKAEYIADKKKFFANNSVYGQEIKGNIEYKFLSDNQVKADFLKEVTTKNGTKEYPSYLVFEKINGDWKLVLESDLISDENIKKKKNISKSKNYEKNLIVKMKSVDDELDDMLSYAESTSDMANAINYAAEAWDAELNNIYKILMNELSQEEQISLRNIQQDWIKRRDFKINEAVEDSGGGSASIVSGKSVFLEETKKRTLELARIYDSL